MQKYNSIANITTSCINIHQRLQTDPVSIQIQQNISWKVNEIHRQKIKNTQKCMVHEMDKEMEPKKTKFQKRKEKIIIIKSWV
jgi:predicted Rossmann fold nucleotide-binding protein DprA/Smf involved in DNA uptake